MKNKKTKRIDFSKFPLLTDLNSVVKYAAGGDPLTYAIGLGAAYSRIIGDANYKRQFLQSVQNYPKPLMNNPFPQGNGSQALYKKGGHVSPEKAKEILRDGTVHGHPLTEKQKRYFGWIAGGAKKPKKKQEGGSADDSEDNQLPADYFDVSQDEITPSFDQSLFSLEYDPYSIFDDYVQYENQLQQMMDYQQQQEAMQDQYMPPYAYDQNQEDTDEGIPIGDSGYVLVPNQNSQPYFSTSSKGPELPKITKEEINQAREMGMKGDHNFFHTPVYTKLFNYYFTNKNIVDLYPDENSRNFAAGQLALQKIMGVTGDDIFAEVKRPQGVITNSNPLPLYINYAIRVPGRDKPVILTHYIAPRSGGPQGGFSLYGEYIPPENRSNPDDKNVKDSKNTRKEISVALKKSGGKLSKNKKKNDK